MKMTSHRTMRTLALPALVAATMVGAALIWRPGMAQDAPAPAKATRAAVVDVTVVLQKSDEWVNSVAQHEALTDEIERVMAPLLRELKALNLEIREAPFGTEERSELMAQGDKKEADYRAKQRDYDQRKQKLFESSYRSVMANMEKAAGEYARAHGIDLVLKTRGVGETTGQAGLMDLHTQTIIHAAPELDITEAVIEAMNAAYDAPIKDN